MSSSTRNGPSKRIINELQQYSHEPQPELLELGPVNDAEITHWQAVMQGVQGTAYEAGCWKLDIQIPDKYPNAPPTIKFITPICHPNVNFKNGEICLDLLKNAWSASYTIAKTLNAIYQMLSYPEPDSPLNVDAAVLLRNGDLVGYESLVRYCCSEWRYTGR